MSLDEIVVAVVVAALGAAGIVEAVRSAVDGLWPARAVSLRWVWRSLAVVAGGVLGYLAGSSVDSCAIGLGAGLCTTSVVAAIKARLPKVEDPKP